MNLKKLFPITLLLALMLVFIPSKKAYADASLEKYYAENGIDSSPSVTVLIDQPIKTSGIVIKVSLDKKDNLLDVGHAFIRVYDGSKAYYYGFYPFDTKNTFLSVVGTKGDIMANAQNENHHNWDYGKIIRISKSQAEELKSYAVNYQYNWLTQTYNLNLNNCATFVANALSHIKQPIPFTRSYWHISYLTNMKPNLALSYPLIGRLIGPTMYGYSPSGAGEDIRNTAHYLVKSGGTEKDKTRIPKKGEVIIKDYQKYVTYPVAQR
jgi:hypothetical protein